MPRRVTAKEGPDPINVHVGHRVRACRTLLGMRQSELGEALGLTFQQVQKYECGADRISASKLWQLTQILDVPVSYFYDDMPADQAGPAPSGNGQEPDVLLKRETLELVRAYHRITDHKARHQILKLVKALAKMGGN